MKRVPVVTVVCITYNQRDYLARALDSFLSQKTTFPYEIYVGDDCSSDGTQDVILGYAERFPRLIKPTLRKENIGAQRNLIDLCSKAESKYIAFCEGDDYWIDDRKLQKQFDYMEAHEQLRACFHDTEVVVDDLGHDWFLARDYSNTDDGKMKWSSGHASFEEKSIYEIKDYIPCGFVHTSSMFIKWDYDLTIPDWYFERLVGDYTIWAIQIGLGRFGYLPEVMSVYRKNPGGCYDFSSREEFWDETKDDWLVIDRELLGYFVRLGADESLIDAFRHRQADDLSKLLKAKVRLGKYQEVFCVCDSYSEDLLSITGLQSPQMSEKLRWPFFLWRLNARLRFCRKIKALKLAILSLASIG